MKKILIPFSLLFFAAAPRTPVSGPFGLRMGMTKAQLGTAIGKNIAPMKYKLKSVAKPHSAFESYVVKISPKTGLCHIRAIGKTIITDAYGDRLRLEYEKIRDQLEGVYGSYTELDGLKESSIWNEKRYWMMSLLKDERNLVARWSVDDGSTMKSGLQGVYLITNALSLEQGYIAVEYAFENYDSCEEETENEARESL